MSKKHGYRLTIMDTEWEFFLQSPTAYRKMHGNDSDAITYPGDYECYFNKNAFTTEVIRHELFHVYHSSSPNGSSNMKPDQVEDQSCELFGRYGPLMMVQVDQILSFFSRKNVLK